MTELKQVLFLCIFFIGLYVDANSQEETNITGQWGGHIEFAERLEAINVVFKNENNVLSGILSIVFEYDKADIPLENIEWYDPKVSFSSRYDDHGKIFFNGEITGDSLKGKIIISTPPSKHGENVRTLNGIFVLKKDKFIEKDRLFLERLITYAEYKNETVDLNHVFTYMDSSDTNLTKLKNKYNLDSIAGNNNEIDKIINLMLWVYNVLPYNGQSGLISPANSLYLLESEKAKNGGINCKLKSVVLNEVYLAMGYPSRVVHCMPKGNNSIESHFIISVYSTELDKWIFMDPSVGAYLKDENGEFLSIQEFRENLISGKKIILNDEAELPADLYFHYMSKNMFRFNCSFNSGFNDGNTDNTSCNLYPILYLESNSGNINDIIVSNPEYFWATPERY